MRIMKNLVMTNLLCGNTTELFELLTKHADSMYKR